MSAGQVEGECDVAGLVLVDHLADLGRAVDAELGGDVLPVVAVEHPAVLVDDDRDQDAALGDVGPEGFRIPRWTAPA